MSEKDEKPEEEGQKRESKGGYQLPHEDKFQELHIDYGFRDAFLRSEPLSPERYDSLYFHGGPGAYFMVPPYEEYLRLFEKFNGRGWSDPDFYLANMG